MSHFDSGIKTLGMDTTGQKTNICVIADDPVMGESLRNRLIMEGFDVDIYDRIYTAHERLQQNYCDIMLCDIRKPYMNGVDLYHKLLNEKCNIPPTVFITSDDTIEQTTDLLKHESTDFVTNPFDQEDLVKKLKAITITPHDPDTDIDECEIGISPTMLAIQKHLKKLSHYHETPLLITGKSGVGKEVVARYLHKQQKNKGPFVAINCSAIPENLIESELFGHEKGAFTGATRTHKGVFEQAHGGTLLLDEIAEMPVFMQAKLLRVMQERTIRRVGGEKDINIMLRLIFSTNKDLEQQVREGMFREDLFFRINVIHTRVPDLQKRKEDILWLAHRFIKEHQDNYPGATITLHDSAKQALLNHTWPGNIRELKHSIERACIMSSDSTIRDQDVLSNPNKPDRSFGSSSTSLKEYIESLEKEKIESILLQYNGCINQSAEHLNISRKSLWEKMKKYCIEK